MFRISFEGVVYKRSTINPRLPKFNILFRPKSVGRRMWSQNEVKWKMELEFYHCV